MLLLVMSLTCFLNMQLTTLHLLHYKLCVLKIQADPERPDGVGSVRRMGFGVIKPLKEEITHLEENKRIEYKLIDNPLVKHHLGRIEFSEITPYITLVTYRIELTAKAPVVSKLILAQLKLAITLGFSRLAKAFASS